jgi:hypothetical protein
VSAYSATQKAALQMTPRDIEFQPHPLDPDYVPEPRDCRRTVEHNGQSRRYACKKWSCDVCGARNELAHIRAAEAVLSPVTAYFIRIRTPNPAHLAACWKRIRSRLPGMCYLGVIEVNGEPHIHAVVDGSIIDRDTRQPRPITGADIEKHCAAAGARLWIEPVDDMIRAVTYCTNKLRTAQKRNARARLIHSESMTAIIRSERKSDASDIKTTVEVQAHAGPIAARWQREETRQRDEAPATGRTTSNQATEAQAHAEGQAQSAAAAVDRERFELADGSDSRPVPENDDDHDAPTLLMQLMQIARTLHTKHGVQVQFTITP